MRFFDLLVLTRCIHQTVNIHFFQFSSASKQCQQITARIAGCGHYETTAVKFNIDSIIGEYHAVENGHQNLLYQHTKDNPCQKCPCAKQRALAHIQLCNLAFLHAKQQINAKLPASLFQNKPYHIVNQPCDNQHDKKRRKSQHDLQDAHLLKHSADIL